MTPGRIWPTEYWMIKRNCPPPTPHSPSVLASPPPFPPLKVGAGEGRRGREQEPTANHTIYERTVSWGRQVWDFASYVSIVCISTLSVPCAPPHASMHTSEHARTHTHTYLWNSQEQCRMLTSNSKGMAWRITKAGAGSKHQKSSSTGPEIQKPRNRKCEQFTS